MTSLVGGKSPYDSIVVEATSDANVDDNWDKICDVYDQVKKDGNSPTACKDCLKSIVKRLQHKNPKVQIQAITLLDSCTKNLEKPFYLEICSRDFISTCRGVLRSSDRAIKDRLLAYISDWAKTFSTTGDPQFDLMPSFYNELRREGMEFDTPSAPPKSAVPVARATDNDDDAAFKAAIGVLIGVLR